MGHPHDPESHSHHNSVWISHYDVDGVYFWGDRGKGKIRHKRIVEFADADEQINNEEGEKEAFDHQVVFAFCLPFFDEFVTLQVTKHSAQNEYSTKDDCKSWFCCWGGSSCSCCVPSSSIVVEPDVSEIIGATPDMLLVIGQRRQRYCSRYCLIVCI